MKDNVNISLSPEIRKKVKPILKKNGQTLSAVIQLQLEDFANKQKGEPAVTA